MSCDHASWKPVNRQCMALQNVSDSVSAVIRVCTTNGVWTRRQRIALTPASSRRSASTMASNPRSGSSLGATCTHHPKMTSSHVQLDGQPDRYEARRLQLCRVSSSGRKPQPASNAGLAAACTRKQHRRQLDTGHLLSILPLAPSRRVEIGSTSQR